MKMSDAQHVETTPDNEGKAAPISDEAKRLIDEAMVGVEVEGKAGEGVEVEGPISADDIQEMSAFCVDLVSDQVSAAHPALPAVYDEDTRQRLAAALAPVLKKYNGAIPAWLVPWLPEIMLAFAIGTVGVATVRAVKAYEADEAEKGGDGGQG